MSITNDDRERNAAPAPRETELLYSNDKNAWVVQEVGLGTDPGAWISSTVTQPAADQLETDADDAERVPPMADFRKIVTHATEHGISTDEAEAELESRGDLTPRSEWPRRDKGGVGR